CESPAAPSHLPPFPTRRSSDLGTLTKGDQGESTPQSFAGESSENGIHRQHISCQEGRTDNSRSRPQSTGHDPAVIIRRGQRVPLDRKSTRLNSSHDQISYAVFC